MMIRKLRASDLPSATGLYRESIPLAFYGDDDKANWESEVSDEIALKVNQMKEALEDADSKVHFLVAIEGASQEGIEGDVVIGAIACYPLGKEIRQILGAPQEHADFRGLLELGSLYVRPEFRGRGVASQLITAMLLWMRTRGIDAFALDSGFTQAVVKWRQKFGEPHIVAKDFWGQGKDHYVWRCLVSDYLPYQQLLAEKKAIIFDFYGTLVDIATDEEQPALWEGMANYYNGLYRAGQKYTPQSLQSAYLALVEEHAAKAKVVASEEYGYAVNHVDIDLLKVFEALVPQDLQDPQDPQGPLTQPEVAALLFRSLSRSRLSAYPFAVELLKWLGQRGYRLVLLSNAQVCFTQLELAATGLIGYFDAIYLSSDYGITKPEPAYFELMLKEQGLKPSDCLFVGNDHLADIAGANGVGMDSVYLHTSCSQAEVPDGLPAQLVLMDGDLSRLLQCFQALEAPIIRKGTGKND